ncbi:hypothetical protein ENH_00007630 [Eimeria necatrix]|uniref:Uncharacterized protein n=1 Tax=Eimeria necatrix TaxID=51315 RepID=U6MT34_9EIME|nr:hypothetical protein ENH_00007630 [Eimeria necatrix]CDJ65604.1 hypothetical protein ENH_00007630 [Eimeria necatrix]
MWSSKCKETAQVREVASRWEMLFKHEVLSSLETPLPVEEEGLGFRIELAKGKAREELARVYCAGADPWKEVSAEMEQQLHEMGAALEEANIEAIKVNCSRPLDQLKAELAVRV